MNWLEIIEEMCRIEFKCKLSELKNLHFYIDNINDKLIIKNYV